MTDNHPNYDYESYFEHECGKSLGIYVHIPFCIKKCAYCDFYSGAFSDGVASQYVNALTDYAHSMSMALCGRIVDTIYFGGGTPTALKADALCRILDVLRECYTVTDNAEITVECNPGTADLDYFKALRRSGFNRISLGVQSMNDSELRSLGRIHTAADAALAVGLARSAGFDNLSVDIMYGIPYQDHSSLESTVSRILELNPEHISAYALSLEEGTPLARMAHTVKLPDEDETADMYGTLNKALSGAGFYRYEISNFARPGFESKHNLRYWLCYDYLGVGASAHSLIGGRRFSTVASTKAFICEKKPNSLEGVSAMPITDAFECLDEQGTQNEYFMLGMRLTRGVSLEKFRNLFGVSLSDALDGPIESYVERGLMALEGGALRFTERGVLVSNYILSDLLRL